MLSDPFYSESWFPLSSIPYDRLSIGNNLIPGSKIQDNTIGNSKMISIEGSKITSSSAWLSLNAIPSNLITNAKIANNTIGTN